MSSSATRSAAPDAPPLEQPLAATLPPELLAIIFENVAELCKDEYEKQLERLRQGEVCRSWFFARIQRNDYVVTCKAQAVALLREFTLNPARAAQASAIEIRAPQASQLWSPLLSLCSRLTSVSLHNRGEIASDALSSLPRTLKRLTLSTINASGREAYITPDFTKVPPQTLIDLTIIWLPFEGATERVVSALSPVVGQVDRLLSLCAPEHQATFNDFVGRMTSLHTLFALERQILSPTFPELIARLTSLETLELCDNSTRQPARFTPELLHNILEHAQPTLKRLEVGIAFTHNLDGTSRAEWSDAAKAELKKFAAAREIKLRYVSRKAGAK